MANAAVLATTLGIPQSYIVTASFVDSVFELPYFVVNDPVKKELVLTVRGTLSVQVSGLVQMMYSPLLMSALPRMR